MASAAEGGVSEEVGKIRIVKSEQAKEQEVTLILPDKILEMDVSSSQEAASSSKPSTSEFLCFCLVETHAAITHSSMIILFMNFLTTGRKTVPKEHKFSLGRPHQNLGVFSHESAPGKLLNLVVLFRSFKFLHDGDGRRECR